jgi:hypothetical protein
MALQHYDVLAPERLGHFVEPHWLPRNTPVFDAQNQLHCIIYSLVNVTKEVQALAPWSRHKAVNTKSG